MLAIYSVNSSLNPAEFTVSFCKEVWKERNGMTHSQKKFLAVHGGLWTFNKWAMPGLVLIYFRSIMSKSTNLQQMNVKNDPSSIQCRNLNLQPPDFLLPWPLDKAF